MAKRSLLSERPTYNTFIKILYMFRALPCLSQEVYVVIVYMQPLVSSLSAGDCLVHRLRKNWFLLLLLLLLLFGVARFVVGAV